MSASRIFRPVAVTTLAAGLLAGTVTPAVAAADSRVAVSKAVQKAVRKAVARQDRPETQKAVQAFVDAGFAGAHMRVNDERGEWTGSAGVRKLGSAAKPPANGLFRVGSVTKTFVATMMLQLVAEGEIGLDTPVAGHLPRFGLDRRITVRMLLQHTSGVYNYTGELDSDGKFVPGIIGTGQDLVDKRLRSHRQEDLVRFALSKPARFEPGTNWSYSNTNYTLAQLLIEKITGHSFAQEMQRRILRPLGLKHTLPPSTRTAIPGPHAHGYYRYEDAGQWKVVDVTRQNPSYLGAAGGMISTSGDLATFFSALNRGKLLPARLMAEMRKPHPKSGALGYGLGVFVQDLGPNCGTVIHHNGSALAGYAAIMYSTPDGKKTLTGSLTMGDAAIDPSQAYVKPQEKLLQEVFCDEQTPS
ncbi:serine hydrolase domain-containing protein [Nonomuraea sp. SBT364]|uniref:serine hydrolase domain-containing protein n=1 Tax=Nonomuraea sp. SBT364 TaxID=1580530 RepID=UPI00066C7D16|nr:serine hydrolase domain-containing protein [Nonomuraea sp. SBT364]